MRTSRYDTVKCRKAAGSILRRRASSSTVWPGSAPLPPKSLEKKPTGFSEQKRARAEARAHHLALRCDRSRRL